MPSRRAATMTPVTPRRTGIFHRESSRLRSNVADQVQRDLLPAGRMLSVFLILCELLAEFAVLIWSKGQTCDRPLRFWVQVLIVLQAGTVLLNCLNIWQGRDTFGQHRNGLSATEIDMYTDTPASSVAPSSSDSPAEVAVRVPQVSTHSREVTADTTVVVDMSRPSAESQSISHSAYQTIDSQPLLFSRSDNSSTDRPSSQHTPPPHFAAQSHPSSSTSTASIEPVTSTHTSIVSTEFVDCYVRIVNAWYLVWFILGSVWVSDGGNCSTAAPHLYRLIIALTIIYYALLFLPLACFCLIVCCLPLFILVYRIMLPYAERERRRARAADPTQVQNLSSIVYSAETFTAHTGTDRLEDASCVICLCDYEADEIVRFLPCKHHFHKDCVDVWLRLDKACCLCKQDIDAQAASAPLSSEV